MSVPPEQLIPATVATVSSEQREALAMKYRQIQQIDDEEEKHAELEKLAQEMKSSCSEVQYTAV
jgi:hypothetical protein